MQSLETKSLRPRQDSKKQVSRPRPSLETLSLALNVGK